MPLFNISGKQPRRLSDAASLDSIDALPGPPRSPNCASSHPDAGPGHRVEPLIHPEPPAVAMDRLVDLIEGLEGAALHYRRGDRYLYATWTTRLMGFVDDVEFLLTAEGAGTRIDIRSASRVGHSDLGANKKRVEILRQALSARGK